MALAIALSDSQFYMDLPALPEILQPDVATRVNTHPSIKGELTQSFEFLEGGGNDYRRDAIILASTWSNATLATLAEAYGLHRDLKAAAHQRSALALNGDVRASLFEARLYGIHVSSGSTSYGQVKTFIATLFTPILTAQRASFAEANQIVAVQTNGFVDYVSRLNLWSQRQGKRIQYEQEDRWGPDHCPEFSVIVFINGKASGTGIGDTLKEARQQAAAIAVAGLTRN